MLSKLCISIFCTHKSSLQRRICYKTMVCTLNNMVGTLYSTGYIIGLCSTGYGLNNSGKALYSAVRDMVYTVRNMVCPCTVWDMVSTKRGLLSVQYGIKIYGGHGR